LNWKGYEGTKGIRVCTCWREKKIGWRKRKKEKKREKRGERIRKRRCPPRSHVNLRRKVSVRGRADSKKIKRRRWEGAHAGVGTKKKMFTELKRWDSDEKTTGKAKGDRLEQQNRPSWNPNDMRAERPPHLICCRRRGVNLKHIVQWGKGEEVLGYWP